MWTSKDRNVDMVVISTKNRRLEPPQPGGPGLRIYIPWDKVAQLCPWCPTTYTGVYSQRPDSKQHAVTKYDCDTIKRGNSRSDWKDENHNTIMINKNA
jgi:hypothetical protein